jgi:hypothetical protein
MPNFLNHSALKITIIPGILARKDMFCIGKVRPLTAVTPVRIRLGSQRRNIRSHSCRRIFCFAVGDGEDNGVREFTSFGPPFAVSSSMGSPVRHSPVT